MKRMVWEPVDTYLELDAEKDCIIGIELDGEINAIRDSGWRADNRVSISAKLPPDIRLCRLTATDEPSVPVTPEVREAIELMKTVLAIDIAAGAYTYLEIGPQLKDAVSKVGSWLNEQAKGGGDE